MRSQTNRVCTFFEREKEILQMSTSYIGEMNGNFWLPLCTHVVRECRFRCGFWKVCASSNRIMNCWNHTLFTSVCHFFLLSMLRFHLETFEICVQWSVDKHGPERLIESQWFFFFAEMYSNALELIGYRSISDQSIVIYTFIHGLDICCVRKM